MKIGILALQGSFFEHGKILQKLRREFFLVRDRNSLEKISHLILPGGESTTILRLLRHFSMFEILREKFLRGEIKIFGTCAGAILLAKIGADFSVTRNAFGAQQSSFSAILDSEKFTNLRGIFIRAPKFSKIKNCEILAKFKNEPVLLRGKNFLAASFHPELCDETRIHEFFLREF